MEDSNISSQHSSFKETRKTQHSWDKYKNDRHVQMQKIEKCLFWRNRLHHGSRGRKRDSFCNGNVTWDASQCLNYILILYTISCMYFYYAICSGDVLKYISCDNFTSYFLRNIDVFALISRIEMRIAS